MLAKFNRFHGHQSVRRTYRQGRLTRGGLMSLHSYSDAKGPRATKAAVVVSRKVDKSAVKRNRVRRRVYEIVRLNMSDFKHPAEMVFTVYKAEAATVPTEQLQQEILNLMKQAKLL